MCVSQAWTEGWLWSQPRIIGDNTLRERTGVAGEGAMHFFLVQIYSLWLLETSTGQGKNKNELEKCAWTVWERRSTKDPWSPLAHFQRSLEEWMAHGNGFAQKAASTPSAYRSCH